VLTAIPIGSKKVGTAMPTFSISVDTDETPMSQEDIMDYIILRLESQNVLVVNNIVRDY
jgi:hypothetical protein